MKAFGIFYKLANELIFPTNNFSNYLIEISKNDIFACSFFLLLTVE